MLNIVQTCLVLHITGIVLLAGTSIATYAMSLQSWKYLVTDKPRSIIINSSTKIFGRLIGIGGLLTILSGFAMVSILREGVTAQIWFRLKMLLVILIVLNGAIYARRQNAKLGRLMNAPQFDGIKFQGIKRMLNVSFFVQLVLFLVIFTLSVFRF